MCKYYVASFALLLVICGGSSAGDPPGILSLKKCYEYRNINKVIPPHYYKGQNEGEVKAIRDSESSTSPDTAPVGGTDAKLEEFNFVAALGYEKDNKKAYMCAASLVSDQFVLTAAHCVHTPAWGTVKYVRLGDVNLKSASDDANVQEITVEVSYVHPNYTLPKVYHDLALLKLSEPVVFTDYVQPICLEPRREVLKRAELYAAGWGLLFAEQPTEYLEIRKIKHSTIEACQNDYPKSRKISDGIVDELQICALPVTLIEGKCESHSGSPLVYRTDDVHKTFQLTGVTSFGKLCGLAVPTVYTRVSNYIDWIERTVWPETTADARAPDPDRIVFVE